VEGVIPRIAEVAQELGLPTIDVYTTLVNYPTYFIDGVHVNYKGAKVIATDVYEAIK
jgi:lysophospholipase L1-like esterase